MTDAPRTAAEMREAAARWHDEREAEAVATIHSEGNKPFDRARADILRSAARRADFHREAAAAICAIPVAEADDSDAVLLLAAQRTIAAQADEIARLTRERDEARRSLRHALVERDQTFKTMHDRATAAEAEAARLRKIEHAARAYYDGFAQDEADDEEYCISPGQHDAAKQLRDALAAFAALEPKP